MPQPATIQFVARIEAVHATLAAAHQRAAAAGHYFYGYWFSHGRA